MLYCIYNGFAFNGRRVDIGKEKSFVEELVKSYLRGGDETIISGERYSAGSDTFQVYEVPAEFGDSNSIAKFIENSYSGNISNHILAGLFRNVTDDFLLGRGYGDLKEDYFNIYINDGLKKPILTVINKKEVLDFLKEFAKGSKEIWVSGRTIKLESPRTIKIFNIDFKWLSKDRGSIKTKIKNLATVYGKWNISVLENFGKEVTSDFEIRPFSTLQVSTALNKNYDEVITNNTKHKIFISHSSNDKIIVDDFVQKILRLGLEITMDKIFCTSIEGMGIRTGDDFRNKIGDELLNAEIVVLMLSSSYKKSEICLNEMGAAWVLNKKVIPIIIPPLEYKEVGVLHITHHIDLINEGKGLDNIVHTLQEFLGLRSSDYRNLNKQRDEFLKLIKTSDSESNLSDTLIKKQNRQIAIQPNFTVHHSTSQKIVKLYNKGFKASKFIFSAANLKGEVKLVPNKDEVDTNAIITVFLGDEFDLLQNPFFELHFSYDDIDGRRYQQTYLRKGISESVTLPELLVNK